MTFESKCPSVQQYQGPSCPRFRVVVGLVGPPSRCPTHLEEYLETGGGDWDYKGGLEDCDKSTRKSPNVELKTL